VTGTSSKGPPERARADTGGADKWVLKRRELPGFAIVNEKKRPHPWDTHHQFSIKTLLSNLEAKIAVSMTPMLLLCRGTSRDNIDYLGPPLTFKVSVGPQKVTHDVHLKVNALERIRSRNRGEK